MFNCEVVRASFAQPSLMVSGLRTNPCTLWICSSPDSGTSGPRIVLPLLPKITVKKIEARHSSHNNS